MAQALLNEWGMDAPTEQLGDVIRLMERLLDGGSQTQIVDGICNLLQQQVPGSRALIGILAADQRTLGDWHAPHLPQELLLDLDDYPILPGSSWHGRLTAGHASAIGDLQRDSSWETLGDVLASNGLRAGMVMPVASGDGTLLALMGLFWLTPHLADPREQLALKRATRLARISLEYLQRQQTLISSEADYRDLAEATTVPLFVLKGEQICYANPAAQRLTGCDGEELHLASPRHFIHPEDHPAARDALLRAQRQSKSGHCRFRVLDPTGKVCPASAEISPIHFQGGPAILLTLHCARNHDA